MSVPCTASLAGHLGHPCCLQLGHECADLGILQPHQLLQLADLSFQDLQAHSARSHCGP